MKAMGPSIARTCPFESRTRVLAAVEASPPLTTIVPALTASSPSFAITSMNPLGGGPWFSACLTSIMNRIFISPCGFGLGAAPLGMFQIGGIQPPFTRRTRVSKIDKPSNFFDFSLIAPACLPLRRFLLQFVAQRLLARPISRRKDAGRKIRRLVDLADLDLSSPVERGALEPFHRFFHGLHLPQPEAADEFLGLGEGPVNYRALLSRKPDPLALRAGLQPVHCKHYAGLYQ